VTRRLCYHRAMRLAWITAALLACGCCGGPTVKPRPYAAPDVTKVVTRLAEARAQLTSFRGESTMDYWLGGQRAKGDVLVMGKLGKRVRFAALSPAGGSTIAEMACDGTNFVYVDYQNNCALMGPCDARSVGMFFGIELEPDDFVHLALGTPPVVGGATGTVTWDGSKGVERVELTSPEGTQRIVIDAKQNRWDVLESDLVGSDGKVRWSVANTDFATVEGSGARRVPGKTRFRSPAQKQDLLVDWQTLQANVELDDAKFVLTAPVGLPACGQQAPAAAPSAPAPAPATGT
jgi:outer membrane lipoprotein-sorting protein